uniref:Glutamate [NMDA] receptor subunit 1 n=1 Tax=Tetranychus urticae TaxID=32264 RepID=T1L122_TETUR
MLGMIPCPIRWMKRHPRRYTTEHFIASSESFLVNVTISCNVIKLTLGRWPSSGHHQNKMSSSESLKVINVGAVLETSESIGQFFQAIEEVNMEPNVLPPGVSLYAISNPPSPNPVRMVQEFCEKMIKSEVYAVVIDDVDSPEASVISQTCDFLNIPVIGLSNRNSYLSDTHMHSVYLRTVPPYSHQVDVWIEMLTTLNYSHVVFIHGADYDGRTTFTRFQSLAEKSGIQIRSVIEYETGVTDIVDELEEADEEIQCRVYLLYANELEAQSIFLEVLKLNMTLPGYVWIVSEAALRATNVPDGVLALQLFNANNRASHIVDSIYIIGLAIRDMLPIENVTRPPSKCGDLSANSWETGPTFYNYLRKQFLLYGKTGRVAFDGKGDRIDAEYEIINRVRGRSVTIGQYAFSQSKMKMHLSLNINEITWPGGQTTQPLGYVRPNHLRIVTLEEEPFIFVQGPVSGAEECIGDTFPCGKTDTTTGVERMYCCSGYCIDFLVDLSRRLNFTYTLYQVADGVYGNFEHVNGTNEPKVWTGLVGDLIYKKADMIVAPLTINPERSLFIEFSKPFKYQGITILEKKLPKRAGLASFLQPFEESLWLLVMISVHVVALALYLLDRFSPFGRYKLPNSDVTEEDALNLSSAIWFAWGVLLNSGIGEGTPRSFSGRVLGMVWAGFAMIVIASYTANLAAFLVLERPTTSLTGINDPRLRNPTESFTYATVKGSAVEMYFKRQVELKEMYEYMLDKNYPTVEDAVFAVKNDEVSALFWDSARLEWEAAKDCDLITAAEQFGRSGYGIGLVKNSFWTEQMNSAILSMHESGFMTDLDNKWILSEDNDMCLNRNDPVPTTLGLRNMAGVFILLGAGIIGGIALIVIEVVYKKRQVSQQRQLESARAASEKWKRFVEKRRLYRTNIHALRQEQLRQEQLRSEKIYSSKLVDSQQPNKIEKPTEGQVHSQSEKTSEITKRNPSQHQQQYYQQSSLTSQYSNYQETEQRSQRLQASSFESDHQCTPLASQHHLYDISTAHHQPHQDATPYTVERGLTEMKMEDNRKKRKNDVEIESKIVTPPSEYQRSYHEQSGPYRSAKGKSSQQAAHLRQAHQNQPQYQQQIPFQHSQQTHPRSLHQGYTASVTPSLSRSAPSSVEIEMAKASLKKSSKPAKEASSGKGVGKSSEVSRKRFLKRESSMNYERGSTPDSYTRGGDSRRGTPSPNQGHLIKPPHALVYSSRPQDFNFSYGYTT